MQEINIEDINLDDRDIKVDLVDCMGDDLTVVNAARVSFNKESSRFWGNTEDPYGPPNYGLYEKDRKLINYLAKNKHISPFGHCFASFRIKAPVFVARQLVKHKFLRWNEVSRRYVDDEPEFYKPDTWRKRADNVKQGSDDTPVDEPLYKRMWPNDCRTTEQAYERFLEYAVDLYSDMIDNGTAPEQARMILPQSMYTEWYWSGSLDAFADMCKLRLDPHAQKESGYVAKEIDKWLSSLYPVSWEALMEN